MAKLTNGVGLHTGSFNLKYVFSWSGAFQGQEGEI